MHRAVAGAIAAAVGFIATCSTAAPFKPVYWVIPAKSKPVVRVPAAQIGTTITPLSTWNYRVKDGVTGKIYKGLMLGQDPHAVSKGVTTLPVQIIPLVVRLKDGTTAVSYNPAVRDPCDNNLQETQVVATSPLFRNWGWTLNGVHVGYTQYVDANQRAEFWGAVHGSNYHLLLSPTVLAPSKLSFGPKNTTNDTSGGPCSPQGETDIDAFDAALQALITGPLASSVNPGTFPVFLLKNVILSFGPTTNCCALGYHSGFYNSAGQLQVYAVADFDSTGYFNSTTLPLSHEIAETVNDPTGLNLTAPWNSSTCQDNLEVADPAGAFMPEITMHGYTYDTSELAYFGWFFHRTPSGGAGQVYSSNGSLTSYAPIYCGG